MIVELLNGGSKIGSRLVLDKAVQVSDVQNRKDRVCIPFTHAVRVPVPIDLAIDNVEPRLASEVLQVL